LSQKIALQAELILHLKGKVALKQKMLSLLSGIFEVSPGVVEFQLS